MGVDNMTKIVYGWKVEGYEQVETLKEKLEAINEDYYDFDFFIEDTMCGNYFYFGAILGSYDAVWSPDEVIINDALSKRETNRYNRFIKDNPEIAKVLDEFKTGEPQLYVFQHIW